MYGWKIDRDYLNVKGDNYYKVGRGRRSRDFETGNAPRERWRLVDDDGIICFGGWLEDDGKSEYDAWQSVMDFGEGWACTSVEQKTSEGWKAVIG